MNNDLKKILRDLRRGKETPASLQLNIGEDGALKFKGQDGYTPQKGIDYWTPEEVNAITQAIFDAAKPRKGVDYYTDQDKRSFVAEVLKLATPVKGRDYRDGRDGVDGRDGKDAEEIDARKVAIDAINFLESFEGDARLSAKALKDLDEAVTEILQKGADFELSEKQITTIKDLLPKYPPMNAGGSGATFLKSLRDVDLSGLTKNADGKYVLGGGTGSSTFLALTDTPAAYTGQAGKLAAVNTSETGIEFIAPPSGSGDVVGPASSVADRIAVFNGLTGKLLKDGGSTIANVLNTDNHTDGTTNKVFTAAEKVALATHVVGPASSTDRAIPVFSGTTGKLLASTDIKVNASTGYLNIGVPTANSRVHIGGTTVNDVLKADIGFDINPVTNNVASVPTVLAVAGNVDIGTHYYFTTFITALGETQPVLSSPTSITTSAGNQQVSLDIPVSSDYRVTGRKIYRSKTSDPSYTARLLATINDNTTTTYVDNIADSALGGNNFYWKENSTAKGISVNGTSVLLSGIGLEPSVALGRDAGRTILNGTAIGGACVFIGVSVGRNLTTGFKNTGIGYGAIQNLTSGSFNNGMGWGALTNITTGSNNVGIGHDAGFRNVTGSNNTLLGYYAGFGVTGNSNDDNSIVGALGGYSLTTGSYNSILGRSAGYSISTGGYNTLIGYRAGYNLTTGSNNIAIGYVNLPSATADNQLSIGNLIYGTELSTGDTLSTGNVGIGTSAPDSRLHVAGAITQQPLSADPADPDVGNSVTWVSDGTGTGDAGDVMMKINVGGVTKIITLIDYSIAT